MNLWVALAISRWVLPNKHLTKPILYTSDLRLDQFGLHEAWRPCFVVIPREQSYHSRTCTNTSIHTHFSGFIHEKFRKWDGWRWMAGFNLLMIKNSENSICIVKNFIQKKKEIRVYLQSRKWLKNYYNFRINPVIVSKCKRKNKRKKIKYR